MAKERENQVGSFKILLARAEWARLNAIKDGVGEGYQGLAHLGSLLTTTKSLVYILSEMWYPWGDVRERQNDLLYIIKYVLLSTLWEIGVQGLVVNKEVRVVHDH